MMMKGILAMRPFHVSALFVQPHSHIRTGGGSTRRSLSYVCRMSSTRPASSRNQYAIHSAASASISMQAEGTCCHTILIALTSQAGVKDMQGFKAAVDAFLHNSTLMQAVKHKVEVLLQGQKVYRWEGPDSWSH